MVFHFCKYEEQFLVFERKSSKKTDVDSDVDVKNPTGGFEQNGVYISRKKYVLFEILAFKSNVKIVPDLVQTCI